MPLATDQIGTVQRVLLVALLMPAFTLVTLGTLPALLLLPFLPGGTDRSIKLIRALITFARDLLVYSNQTPNGMITRNALP